MRWAVVVVLVAGCATGCAVGQQLRPAGRAASDQCGAGQVAALVGQPFVALADVTLPGALRVLYPGQMVVAEVVPTRLNAAVDGAARITEVFCG